MPQCGWSSGEGLVTHCALGSRNRSLRLENRASHSLLGSNSTCLPDQYPSSLTSLKISLRSGCDSTGGNLPGQLLKEVILDRILGRAILTLLQDQGLIHFWVPSMPEQNHRMWLCPGGCGHSSDSSGQAPVDGLFPESLKSNNSLPEALCSFYLTPRLELSKGQSRTHISLIFHLLPNISGPGNRQGFSISYPPCSVFCQSWMVAGQFPLLCRQVYLLRAFYVLKEETNSQIWKMIFQDSSMVCKTAVSLHNYTLHGGSRLWSSCWFNFHHPVSWQIDGRLEENFHKPGLASSASTTNL